MSRLMLTTLAGALGLAGTAMAETSSPLTADQLSIKLHPSATQVYYPEQAREDGVEGKVMLACAITRAQRLRCEVQSENPAGAGFGKTARQLFDTATVSWKVANNAPLAGQTVQVPFVFKMN